MCLNNLFVITESILVIPTVGIQSSIKYVCGREDYFIPWSNIDDVIINEVIKLVSIFKINYALIVKYKKKTIFHTLNIEWGTQFCVIS